MCGGAICGGVMSETMMRRGMKKHGAYFGMMSWVMPDKHFKKYVALCKDGNKEKADKLFARYAVSQC